MIVFHNFMIDHRLMISQKSNLKNDPSDQTADHDHKENAERDLQCHMHRLPS